MASKARKVFGAFEKRAPGARFSKDPKTYRARFSKRKQCIGIKLCMEVNFVLIKIVKKKKNSSVNCRFKIFVVAFRARKLFGTFEKRAPGHQSEHSLLLATEH